MKAPRTVLVLVALLALLCGGAWLATGPRAHVPVPGADAQPADVVRAYVTALDARDYATVHAIAPQSVHMQGMSRWSTHPVRMDDVRILSVTPGTTADAQARAAGRVVMVTTRATLVNVNGAPEDEPGTTWSFTLGRDDDAHPWQVLEQGQG